MSRAKAKKSRIKSQLIHGLWVNFHIGACSSNDGEPTTLDDKDCFYQISHNPTGLYAICDIPDKKEAREIVRKLAMIPIRWNGRGDMPKEFDRQVKEVINEYI